MTNQNQTSIKHHLPFRQFNPPEKCKGGYRLRATKSSFPVLQGMSFYKLALHSRAVREPHWHANADELGYCLQGNLLVSIYGNRNMRESFLVCEGEAFFIPSGALHAIENVGKKTAEIILQFSNEEPEDFDLSTVFGVFSDSVLGNTWGMQSSHFRELKRPSKKSLIAQLNGSTEISKADRYVSPYQFGLEASAPLISNPGGTAKVARQNVWPILKRQALYSLHLTGKGMREPHWHPETAEMGYIAKGKGRMSIISPSGKVDTYQMKQGDIYFIPKAYPHHIENLSSSGLQVMIFFDQPMPQDVGFSASLKSFSDEVLASSIQSSKELFTKLTSYYEDLFIVGKKNP
ncbi:MAG: cupin domain-containing protein [Parachlamydiales bacterium]|nr:cupin domain-containing protein [Parachlamydiales bacterium]